jgi:hypothetical protein
MARYSSALSDRDISAEAVAGNARAAARAAIFNVRMVFYSS